MKLVRQWKQQPDESVRIVAFGSSNTELTWSNNGRHNWVDWLNVSLRAHIGRHICVINQGIGGETTEHLLERIDRDVFSFRPAAVIVTVGGNDALTGMPLRRYADNLRRICSSIVHHGAEPILQTYYCPMYHLGDVGFRETFERFMEAKRELARELGLTLVDQISRFEPFYTCDPEQYARLMNDWIHVNHLGHLLMGQHMATAFGLPDLLIPADIGQEVRELMARMQACGANER